MTTKVWKVSFEILSVAESSVPLLNATDPGKPVGAGRASAVTV